MTFIKSHYFKKKYSLMKKLNFLIFILLSLLFPQDIDNKIIISLKIYINVTKERFYFLKQKNFQTFYGKDDYEKLHNFKSNINVYKKTMKKINTHLCSLKIEILNNCNKTINYKHFETSNKIQIYCFFKFINDKKEMYFLYLRKKNKTFSMKCTCNENSFLYLKIFKYQNIIISGNNLQIIDLEIFDSFHEDNKVNDDFITKFLLTSVVLGIVFISTVVNFKYAIKFT